MVIKQFPSPSQADESGLLAIGGDLEVESLILAYRNGIFPWPFDDTETDNAGLIPWFSPKKRGVLFLKDFKIPHRFQRELKKKGYTYKIDQDFEKVITACRKTRIKKSAPSQTNVGTWITPMIIQAYTDLYRAGHCHSISCYREDKLVGGLYGVSIGKMFAGESMFHLEQGASKRCLCFLVDYLKAKDVTWIDCQQLTPLLQSFGAKEIDRQEFQLLLADAVGEKGDSYIFLSK